MGRDSWSTGTRAVATSFKLTSDLITAANVGPSSIEHGGTGTFSIMWYFCEVNLCVTIIFYMGLLVVRRGGGGYMVPLAHDNGMVPH